MFLHILLAHEILSDMMLGGVDLVSDFLTFPIHLVKEAMKIHGYLKEKYYISFA